MKGIRRVIAVFVMMAMVIGVASFSGKEVSATENFRITAPESNSLIGAGHFDIKWTNSETKNVKTYRVYMDKKKVGETTDNKLDCYTTKVATHSAYVEVEYVDGTSDKTATISFAVSKKGLGLATDMGAKINLKDMKCSWYYNWGNNPSSGSQYQNVEFVPMLWRERNQATIKRKLNGYVESGYKYVLAFNEPDMSKQCNMSVDEVFNLWPAMMNDNINVSSPVTATWPTASEDWFIPFMEKIDATIIVRGLRAVTDFEYELQIAQSNHRVNPKIDTVFLTTNVKYSYLSSTIVKEYASYGGDISHFVPPQFIERIYDKYNIKK